LKKDCFRKNLKKNTNFKKCLNFKRNFNKKKMKKEDESQKPLKLNLKENVRK